MNENINLCKILKDCPKGICFYSPICGNVEFVEINPHNEYPIVTQCVGDNSRHPRFTIDGKYLNSYINGECILFPSQELRDWSKWRCPKSKFDPKRLKAFDRILARVGNGDAYCWYADFVSIPSTDGEAPYIMSEGADMVIPYNDETKHLVGTSNEAPEYYRYWED